MRIILSFQLILLLIFNSYGQEWSFRTVDQGVKPSIALDSQDRPHLCYSKDFFPDSLKYALLTNNVFQIDLVGEEYYFGPTAIAIDQNDIPFLACHNHNQASENIFHLDNTGTWQSTILSHPNHDGWSNSIAFDSQGNIYTSSADPSNTAPIGGLELAFFDGVSWTKEILTESTNKIGSLEGTSIVIDSNDEPHITYSDLDTTLLYYAKRTAGIWEIDTVTNTGGIYSSLVLDANDEPHIAYYSKIGNTTSGMIKYAEKGSGTWVSQTLDNLNNVTIGGNPAQAITSLKIDSSNKLHLSYGDKDVHKYGTLESNGWMIQTIKDVTSLPSELGPSTSLALDSNDDPHIAFYEIISNSPIEGNIIYARFCNDDLTIIDNTINGPYKAANTIVTSGAVSIGSEALFSAGQSVTLQNEFTVPLNSTFTVVLNGCN